MILQPESLQKAIDRLQKYGPRSKPDQRFSTVANMSACLMGLRVEYRDYQCLEDVIHHIYVDLPAEKREYVLDHLLDKGQEAFDIFSRFCSSYAYHGQAISRFQNVFFTEGGAARLSNICGWLHGLYSVSEEGKVFAKRAALLFLEQLDYLNGYGGDIELPVTQETVVNVPRYRVVLGDDGVLNSFTLLWHGLISNEKRHEKAQEVLNARVSSIEQLVKDDDVAYQMALKDAETELGIFDKLTLHRFYRDQSLSGRSIPGTKIVYYGRSFNGGLIYHGPGSGETFSVCLDPAAARERLWSVHT